MNDLFPTSHRSSEMIVISNNQFRQILHKIFLIEHLNTRDFFVQNRTDGICLENSPNDDRLVKANTCIDEKKEVNAKSNYLSMSIRQHG